MTSDNPTTSSTSSTRVGPRRGRLPDDERAARRAMVIDAAFAELIEHGYECTTMLSIARRANASKETLYSWFGNRQGLFSAMIADNADRTGDRVREALDGGADPRATLVGFGVGLLRLLTSDRSVALNRASMVAPDLASELLRSGRHRLGPLVERYLTDLTSGDVIALDDPRVGFEVYYGLLVRDTRIRVLLGEEPPSDEQIRERAESAVEQFFVLFGRSAT